MNEFDLLVFRADETASKGITSAHLDDIISGYDPAKQPAPVVIGHPTNDTPAHGIVSGLYRTGSELFAKVQGISDELIGKVKAKKILSRSIAIWDPSHPSNPNKGKYGFRHLGFLGAAAPGIPNLGALKFSADDDTIVGEGEPGEAIIFAAAPTPTKIITEEPPKPAAKPKEFSVTEEEIKLAQAENERIAKANKDEAERLEAQGKQFAADLKTRTEAANAAAVDALVTAGQVLPADKDALVMAFNAIPGETLEFSAEDKGSAVSKICAIIGKLPKIVPIGDEKKSPSGKGPEYSAGADEAKEKYEAARDERTAKLEGAHKA